MDTVQPEPSPIVSYDQPAAQELPPQPEGRSFHISKKLVILVGVIFVILLLSGVVILKSKKATPATTAQFQNLLLATVGDQKIYTNDVIHAAGEQYTSAAITKDIQKKYLNILIERAILDREAKKLNISVTEAEVMQNISSSSAKSPGLLSIVKYQLIKNQIIQKQVTSVQAYLIGYWIPPFDYQQVPLFAQERTVGRQALQEGKTMLQKGDSPLSVAQTLYQKYPLLDQIWSINGYFMNKLKDNSLAQTPRTLTVGQSDIDKSIFALKKGEIAIIDGPNGAGASLVQIVSINNGEFTTYEKWLADQKKTLVTMEIAL